MKRTILSFMAMAACQLLFAQNVGIGESSPTAKLEIKGDGNSNATNAFLLKNSGSTKLLHIDNSGTATFGSVSFPSPGHIIGIHNGNLLNKAHIALYATGALMADAGSVNRIGFSNLTNGFRQFEIQSYSGTAGSEHALSFKYFTFSPNTETNLLNLNANGTATFSGTVVAPNVNAATISAPNLNVSNLNVTGGTASDFLIKNSSGTTSFRKGHGALGMNYIICTNGAFPTFGAGSATDQPMIAEVRLWAGVTAPTGWAFCQGQILLISSNTALFSLIGTLYGGNGATTFALPDLRGAVPIQQGTPTAGAAWGVGQRSF